jgi:hypothetical protein
MSVQQQMVEDGETWGFENGREVERAAIVAFGRAYATKHLKRMGLWAQRDLLGFLDALERCEHMESAEPGEAKE